MNKFRAQIKWLSAVVLPAMIMMFSTQSVTAQEHPEHPEAKDTTEHPEHHEHPEHPQKAFEVDIETMAKAITDYIETDSKLKGGYFLVYDPASKRSLQLTLTKVHKERLAQVGENLFFACSDFDEKGGQVFDLDFFMKAEDGKLNVTEIMVHKEEGKPRYQWYEEGGTWKRK